MVMSRKVGAMKCKRCQEFYQQFKYVKTVECRPAGEYGNRYGMFYVSVGVNYIGKKFRVMIMEARDEEI